MSKHFLLGGVACSHVEPTTDEHRPRLGWMCGRPVIGDTGYCYEHQDDRFNPGLFERVTRVAQFNKDHGLKTMFGGER